MSWHGQSGSVGFDVRQVVCHEILVIVFPIPAIGEFVDFVINGFPGGGVEAAVGAVHDAFRRGTPGPGFVKRALIHADSRA